MEEMNQKEKEKEMWRELSRSVREYLELHA
jgi:hypothetical protein